MGNKTRFLILDFLKECRDYQDDAHLRRKYSAVIDDIINTINPLDYLIYEKEKKHESCTHRKRKR